MSFETKERAIGDHVYAVRMLSASEGRKMIVRLVRTLGPAFAALVAGEDKQASAEQTSGAISKACEELAARLTEEDLDYVCKVFGSCTTITLGGKTRVLDLQEQELHFSGRFGLMFRWLGFALEANFSDFFPDGLSIASAVGAVRGKAEAPSASA